MKSDNNFESDNRPYDEDEDTTQTADQDDDIPDTTKQPWYVRFAAHPLTPSWRRLSRYLVLLLLLLSVWALLLSTIGLDAMPGKELFGLVMLCVVAQLAGYLCQLINKPPLLGMLVVGVTLRTAGAVNFQGDYLKAVIIIRKMALAIIMIRAGLGLDPAALKRMKFLVLLMSTCPATMEAMSLMVATHFFLEMPWLWGLLLGYALGAVSPAVVISCLFNLQSRGYGINKGIPTIVIAAAGLDDVTAISGFHIVLSIMFSKGSLTMKIIQTPLAIIIGVVFGITWGTMTWVIPQQKDSQVIPLRTLLICTGGFLAVLGSHAIDYDAAGALGCILLSYVACQGWKAQGWGSINPVTTHFRLMWVVFQTFLFAFIGAEIDLLKLDLHYVGLCLASLGVGLVFRFLMTIAITFTEKFNWKERLFIGVSWLPKATVQAALGSVALDIVRKTDHADDIRYAEYVLTCAVMGILLTAPTGAILISLLGPYLLTKSVVQQSTTSSTVHMLN